MDQIQIVLDGIHRAAPMGIGLTVNRVIQSVNPRFSAMLGYTEGELIGQSARMLYHDQTEFERVGRDKYDQIREQGIGSVETTLRRKDGGSIDVLLSSAVLDEARDATKRIIFTAVDISPLKRIQHELEKTVNEREAEVAARTRDLKQTNLELEEALRHLRLSQIQILQSEKMASIGQLAAGVAHEINNPTAFVSSNLNAIGRHHSELCDLFGQYRRLLSDLATELPREALPLAIKEAISGIQSREEQMDVDFMVEDLSDLIQESKEGVGRIQTIVRDLVDFARPGQKERDFFEVNKGLDAAINIAWHEIKHKAELVKDYGELPSIYGHCQQLNQIFLNLLVNAAEAMDIKGRIDVRTRANGDHVVIRICDNGRGIPESDLARIFDPFFTTKAIGKGTGLGLSVVYGIIKNHGGEIQVSSQVNKGTTFTIRLPLESVASESKPAILVSTVELEGVAPQFSLRTGEEG